VRKVGGEKDTPGPERGVDDPAAGARLFGRVGRLGPAVKQQQKDEGRKVFGAHFGGAEEGALFSPLLPLEAALSWTSA